MADAPGTDKKATVAVPDVYDIYVRVRDNLGRPLPKASMVLFTVEGQKVSVTADEHGLAVAPGVTVRSAVTITAAYVPHFDRPAEQPVQGQSVMLVAQRDSFGPDITPENPSPVPVSPNRQLFATVFVPVQYSLKHLFSWQNNFLRKRIWYAALVSTSFRQFNSKDEPTKNRSAALASSLRVLKKRPKLDSELDTAQHELAAAQAVKVKQVPAPPDPADPAADTPPPAKGHAAKHPVKTIPDPTQQAAKDANVLSKQTKLNDLNKEKSDHDANSNGTHKALLEEMFNYLKDAKDLQTWAKYGIIHLTGFRYREAVSCYMNPRQLAYNFREKEIDEEEHPSPESTAADGAIELAQRHYAREYLALFARDLALLDAAEKRYANQHASILAEKLEERQNRDAKPLGKGAVKLVDLLTELSTRDQYWLDPKKKKPPPVAKGHKVPDPGIFILRAVASAISLALSDRAGRKPDGSNSAWPPDERDFLGNLIDRYFVGKPGNVPAKAIPDGVWETCVRSTQLINDFVDPKLTVEDFVPDDWFKKPAAKLGKEWDRVFPTRGPAAYENHWGYHHRDTLQPYGTSAVCNDVAWMLGRARGADFNPESWSIMGMAETCYDASPVGQERIKAAAAKAAAAKAAAAGKTAPTTPGDPPPADAAKPAEPPAEKEKPAQTTSAERTAIDHDRGGLFWPTHVKELRPGDNIFFTVWSPLFRKESWLAPARYFQGDDFWPAVLKYEATVASIAKKDPLPPPPKKMEAIKTFLTLEADLKALGLTLEEGESRYLYETDRSQEDDAYVKAYIDADKQVAKDAAADKFDKEWPKVWADEWKKDKHNAGKEMPATPPGDDDPARTKRRDKAIKDAENGVEMKEPKATGRNRLLYVTKTNGRIHGSFLTFMHISTVIRVDETHGDIITLETADPPAVIVRRLGLGDDLRWVGQGVGAFHNFCGRTIATKAHTEEELGWYLKQDNLFKFLDPE